MGDDEWSTSKISRGFKGRNLFDDDVEDARLKDPFSHLGNDNVATVDWDGEPISVSETKMVQSARNRQSINHAVYDKQSVQFHNSKGNDAAPQSLPRSQSGIATSKQTTTALPSKSFAAVPHRLSITDLIQTDSYKPPDSSQLLLVDSPITLIAKHETTIKQLRREIEGLRYSTSSTISPADTVMRIFNGQKYSLEVHKSLAEKQELLDCAIEYHDGNAITAVILFLKDTLRDTIFYSQLKHHPEAVNHYINFLRLTDETESLVKFLSYLGRSEEVAMIKYKQMAAVPDVESRIDSLQFCLKNYFRTSPSLAFQAGIVQQQIDLLQRQLPVDKADEEDQKRGRGLFKDFPRAAPLIKKSVITTAVYSCLYHYDELETHLASAQSIKKFFKLTDRQFIISAIRGRGKLKKWPDIEALFQTKSWFGGTKVKTDVSFEVILRLLQQYNAPVDVLGKYCEKISDLVLRVNLAKKYDCFMVALEAIRQLRDREMLEQFARTLPSNSAAAFYADKLKNDPSVKWKN